MCDGSGSDALLVTIDFTRSHSTLKLLCSQLVRDGTTLRWAHPPISLGDFTLGNHRLAVAVAADGDGWPLARASSGFFVGELGYTVRDKARTVYYALHPQELWHRVDVLRKLGFGHEARADAEAAAATIPESPSSSNLTAGIGGGSPAVDVCPNRFISFRNPMHGLNNQMLEVTAMVAIAKALGRTLVLPRFPSHAPMAEAGAAASTNESDGGSSSEMLLDFDELFDFEHFAATLRGTVCAVRSVEAAELLALTGSYGGESSNARGFRRRRALNSILFGPTALHHGGFLLTPPHDDQCFTTGPRRRPRWWW